MPLLLLGMFAPRFTIFVLWLFSNYMARSEIAGWVAVLGFLFMPTTTLAYAIAMVSLDGVQDFGLVLVIIGVFVDLVLHGDTGRRGRR